jgi:hypothetical protein
MSSQIPGLFHTRLVASSAPEHPSGCRTLPTRACRTGTAPIRLLLVSFTASSLLHACSTPQRNTYVTCPAAAPHVAMLVTSHLTSLVRPAYLPQGESKPSTSLCACLQQPCFCMCIQRCSSPDILSILRPLSCTPPTGRSSAAPERSSTSHQRG